ncbi:MAG: Gfo/Idh/MocA family protein [Armatimonadota bacterium]
MPIRTAIIGYGRNGKAMHGEALARNDAFQVAAVCDIDPARLQLAKEDFGCALYDDYRRMLAEEQLDFVVIVTRSSQHCEMTCDALNAGVNVLVTKPWALNEAEARRMVSAQQTSGKQLLPWLPSRWGSDTRRIKELIDAGTIGSVFFARHTVCSFGTRSDWQTEKQYGGGYLLNWGPHIVDPPLQVLGSPVRSAYGRMKQVINPGDVEDVFFGLLTLENGTLVQVEYTIALENLPTWYIQGDRGTIVTRGRNIKILQNTPARPDDPTKFATMQASETQITEEEVAPDIYGDEHKIYIEIAQALTGERPYPIAPASALELTRVLDAIRTASEEDRVVTLGSQASRACP